MATVTLRPNGTVSLAGGWTVTGAGSTYAALADDSDASYIARSNGIFIGTVALVDMTTVALPALAQVRSVTGRVRISESASVSSSTLKSMSWNLRVSGLSAVNGAATVSPPVGTPTNYSGPAASTNPYGGAWSQADLDALQVGLGVNANGGTWTAQFYEVYADVVYNEAPVAAVTAPSGVQSADSKPPVVWTYTDPEGDVQERYQVKVFDGATYGAGGFDPETTTPTVSSGEVFSAATTWTPPTALRNNTSYRAYVKVADVGSSGRYGAWAYVQFQILVDPPGVPTVTATSVAGFARVDLGVNGTDNLLTANQADLETITDGWAATANCTIARTTAAGTFLHGSAALALTSAAAGTMEAATPTVAVAPGGQYTALASFKSAGTARNTTVAIYWYTAARAGAGAAIYSAATPDSAGGWVQAAVTATAPPSAAFAAVVVSVAATGAVNEVHYVDQIGLAPGASTTWTRGGYVNPAAYPMGTTIQVQRSVDGGATWTYVKGLGPTDGYATFPPLETGYNLADNQAPFNTSVQYRAAIVVVVAGKTIVSDWSAPATTSLNVNQWWLKDPSDPTANVALSRTRTALKSKIPKRLGVFTPLGRNRKVTINGGILGAEFDLETVVFDAASFAAIKKLWASTRTLLVQSPTGEQWYVDLGDFDHQLLPPGNIAQLRTITLAMIEVGVP